MIKNCIIRRKCSPFPVSIIILVSFFQLSSCGDGSSDEIDGWRPAPVSNYIIGGEVSGLRGSLTIELEGQEVITVSQNGVFNFAHPITEGSDYSVIILAHPHDQICALSNNVGISVRADINNIQIDCFYSSLTGTIYGDSQANGGVIPPQGWMCETLHLYTDVDLTLHRRATGGYDLQDIRAIFESEFPKAGENFVIIEGGINDIVNTGGSLERMKSDISIIAEAVLAAEIKLVIVNVPPWKGHVLHTEQLQLLTDNYNNWLKATYPDNVADIYSALEDPDHPDQLLPIYSASYPAITNLHISKSGMRRADEVIGKHFKYFNAGAFEIHPTNSFPHPKNLDSWMQLELVAIEGDVINLANGTEGSSQSLVSTSTHSRHGVKADFSDTHRDTNIIISYLARAGDKQWIRSSYTDKAGVESLSYIDVINLASIHYSGAYQTVKKYSPGWVQVKMATNAGSGGNETLSLIVSEDDADDTFAGNNGTPDIYFDLIQVVAN